MQVSGLPKVVFLIASIGGGTKCFEILVSSFLSNHDALIILKLYFSHKFITDIFE